MVGTTGNRNSTTINRLYGVIRQMNSKERHEARYQRRKMKRLLHKRQKEAKNGDFDKVFTFSLHGIQKVLPWRRLESEHATI